MYHAPMQWLVRLYDKRIINVNVNIIVAGLLAAGITVGVMQLLQTSGALPVLQGKAPNIHFSLGLFEVRIVGATLVVSGTTLGVDALADIIVYTGLHWFANHMPRKRIPRIKPEYQDLTFIRDATLVQFERAVLSPLLYVIALGLQNWLLHRGWNVAAATSTGLIAGMVVARTLHTIWMIRQERRKRRNHEAKKAEAAKRAAEAAAAPATERTQPQSAQQA